MVTEGVVVVGLTGAGVVVVPPGAAGVVVVGAAVVVFTVVVSLPPPPPQPCNTIIAARPHAETKTANRAIGLLKWLSVSNNAKLELS